MSCEPMFFGKIWILLFRKQGSGRVLLVNFFSSVIFFILKQTSCSCGHVEGDWTINDLPNERRWHFEDCSLARGLVTENIPLERKPLEFVGSFLTVRKLFYSYSNL